jgi:hypothetical protein
MSDIEKFENTIANLKRKREACVKRGVELADERAAVALAAHTGDTKAAKRLGEIHTALATQASEVASFDAALEAAASKLATAQQAEVAERDKVSALALRKTVAEIGECMQYADKHFALAIKALVAADTALDQVHAAGSDFPTRMQFAANAERALKTAIMGLPRYWWRDWSQHLAPNERRGFAEFWARMQVPLENNVRRRLGEPPIPEAIDAPVPKAPAMQRSDASDRREAAADLFAELEEAPARLLVSAVFRNDPAYRRFYRLWQDIDLGIAAIFGDFLKLPLAGRLNCMSCGVSCASCGLAPMSLEPTGLMFVTSSSGMRPTVSRWRRAP